MKKSTPSKVRGKIRPDKPPFAHQSGRWAKKVNGRFAYLGKIADDPHGDRARKVWAEQGAAIRAGRRPILDENASPAGVTIKVLCDTFLAEKEAATKTGELAPRSFQDYHRTCLRVADAFGRHRLVADLTPADFAHLRATLANGRGPLTLKADITRVRVMFKWGFEWRLLDNAVRFGPGFKLPSAKAQRVARANKGPRLFEQAELRRIIEAADVQLRAMVLLGINCGLGNADCARLKFRHIDLRAGWLDFARPKTGEPRRCQLWPETVQALEAAIAARPAHADPADSDLVFLTELGGAWRKDTSRNSPLSQAFGRLLNRLKFRRLGVNFYALRHTLQTIGEGALDRTALARIMGHVAAAGDMASIYRERIDDTRLVAVANHVRKWLFPKRPKKK
jgi:integrase